MCRTRNKLQKGVAKLKKEKHKEYVFLTAHQKRKGLSDAEVAEILGISTRTYQNKVKGLSDFTLSEAIKLCETLEESKETLFLT
jgi:plasmid maintenance system antidote protein VapI